MNKHKLIKIYGFFLLLVLHLSSAQAQKVKIIDYPLHSGTFSGEFFSPNRQGETPILLKDKTKPDYYTIRGLKKQSQHKEVFSEIIKYPEAKGVRLIFKSANLGKNSYIRLESVKDGAIQLLDSLSLRQWNFTSAYFNGNQIKVSLHVSKENKMIYFDLDKIIVEFALPEERPIESICDIDNRVRTTDRAIGRLTNAGNTRSNCTIWITSNGSLITAGHCVPLITRGFNVAEFNIPISNLDGSVNHPAPQNQYPIDVSSIVFENGNIGNDWAVFNCNANANTGLMPAQGQQAFYRMSRDHSPSRIRITGCGIDDGVDNRTLQTSTGLNLGEDIDNANSIFWEYQVDTRGGNSGSPVIWDGTNTAIGVHTNGGCSRTNGNQGTSFEANDLEQAIHQIWGSAAIYVDNGDQVVVEDGSIFRPYNQLQEGINTIANGGILPVVSGRYNEKITINKPLTIVAPVGNVIIGSATAGTVTDFRPANIVGDNRSQLILDENQNQATTLLTVYPNPNKGIFTLSVILPDSETINTTLTLYNHQGEIIFAEKISNSKDINFNLLRYPKGLYFARLSGSSIVDVYERIIYQ